MSFHRAHKSEVSVAAASLDDPERITPEFHMMMRDHMPWLKVDDGLPSHDRFPPEGEDRDAEL